MKDKNNTGIKYFTVSAVITALVIILICMFIIAEANTSALGIKSVSDIFSVSFDSGDLNLLINDRQYSLTIDAVYDFFKSKAPFLISAVWLVI